MKTVSNEHVRFFLWSYISLKRRRERVYLKKKEDFLDYGSVGEILFPCYKVFASTVHI